MMDIVIVTNNMDGDSIIVLAVKINYLNLRIMAIKLEKDNALIWKRDWCEIDQLLCWL